jgi:iron complex outermembrane recepter protein
VGSKNRPLDKTLIANVAAFYYIDKNMQYHAEDLINFDGGVDNLPEVDVYGLEGEFTALLPYHFRFDGTHCGKRQDRDAYFDDRQSGRQCSQRPIRSGIWRDGFHRRGIRHIQSRSAERIGAAECTASQGLSRRLRQFAAEPADLTVSLALSQTSQFSNGSSLLSRLQGNYRDHFADTVFGNSPIYTTPSYVMMNLFFDYTFPNRRLDLTFAVTNLANREEVSYRFTNQYGGETTQSWFPPREYVIGIGYKF